MEYHSKYVNPMSLATPATTSNGEELISDVVLANQKMVFAQNDPFDRWMKQNLRGEGQKDVHGDWKPRPYHWVKVDVVWYSYQKYIKDNNKTTMNRDEFNSRMSELQMSMKNVKVEGPDFLARRSEQWGLFVILDENKRQTKQCEWRTFDCGHMDYIVEVFVGIRFIGEWQKARFPEHDQLTDKSIDPEQMLLVDAWVARKRGQVAVESEPEPKSIPLEPVKKLRAQNKMSAVPEPESEPLSAPRSLPSGTGRARYCTP